MRRPYDAFRSVPRIKDRSTPEVPDWLAIMHPDSLRKISAYEAERLGFETEEEFLWQADQRRIELERRARRKRK